jgi:hypothetical protein
MPITIKFSQNNTGSVTIVTPSDDPAHNHPRSFVLLNLSEEIPDQIIHALNRVFPTDHVTVFPWPKGNADWANPWLKRACLLARFIVVDKKDTPLFLEEEHLIENKTYVVSEQETWDDIFVRIRKEKFPN